MESEITDLDGEFIEFPKMARLMRGCIITEKIDGTNAQIFINISGEIRAGSRNRWLTPAADNFGFARWVEGNKLELLKLGPGRHFGEWWGAGIQRGYGLKEKRFSLFNTIRWCPYGQQPIAIAQKNPTAPAKMQDVAPACVSVVPILDRGVFSTENCTAALISLANYGSQAAPGFMNPEGIVVWHAAANVGFKLTLLGDGHKGA